MVLFEARSCRQSGRSSSQAPPLAALEDGSDFEEEVGLDEFFIGAGVRPDSIEADFVAVLKPIGDLLDGGLFEVVGERGLAGVGRVAGENVAARVRHARECG